MGGPSPQEKAGQALFSQIGGTSANVPDLFSGFSYPFSAAKQFGALTDYTNLGTKSIKRQTAENVAGAGSATTSALTSRGYGGSILSDAVGKAREGAAAGGTNALEKLQADRLALLPGIMATANKQAFDVTSAENATNIQNMQNQFQKWAMQQGLLGSFSSSNTLGDVLGGITSVGSLLPGVGKFISALKGPVEAAAGGS